MRQRRLRLRLDSAKISARNMVIVSTCLAPAPPTITQTQQRVSEFEFNLTNLSSEATSWTFQSRMIFHTPVAVAKEERKEGKDTGNLKNGQIHHTLTQIMTCHPLHSLLYSLRRINFHEILCHLGYYVSAIVNNITALNWGLQDPYLTSWGCPTHYITRILLKKSLLQ